MKDLSKFALTGITVAGIAFVIGLVTPQRLGSQYASPVNVMNSKSAPAMIRDTDGAARTPYHVTMNGTDCGPPCSFPNVPANKRLVITHFDALVDLNVSQENLTDMTLTNSSGNQSVFPLFSSLPPDAGIKVFLSSRAVEFYVDAGDNPVAFFDELDSGGVAPVSVTLTGYLVDCTNSCAPIVH